MPEEWGIVIEVATFIAGVGTLVTVARKLLKPVQATNNALRAIIKNAITRTHKEVMAAKRIDRNNLEAAMEMHGQYKRLGGNGYVDKLIEDIKKIPIIESEGIPND